jgi:phytoene dehydrogenase-like protein
MKLKTLTEKFTGSGVVLAPPAEQTALELKQMADGLRSRRHELLGPYRDLADWKAYREGQNEMLRRRTLMAAGLSDGSATDQAAREFNDIETELLQLNRQIVETEQRQDRAFDRERAERLTHNRAAQRAFDRKFQDDRVRAALRYLAGLADEQRAIIAAYEAALTWRAAGRRIDPPPLDQAQINRDASLRGLAIRAVHLYEQGETQ